MKLSILFFISIVFGLNPIKRDDLEFCTKTCIEASKLLEPCLNFANYPEGHVECVCEKENDWDLMRDCSKRCSGINVDDTKAFQSVCSECKATKTLTGPLVSSETEIDFDNGGSVTKGLIISTTGTATTTKINGSSSEKETESTEKSSSVKATESASSSVKPSQPVSSSAKPTESASSSTSEETTKATSTGGSTEGFSFSSLAFLIVLGMI